MTITHDQLRQVIASIWESMFPGAECTPHPVGPKHPTQHAHVEVAGGTYAVIAVEVEHGAATALAELMFGEDVDLEGVRDAVTELVNQIGGGTKGLLDGECVLQIPQPGPFSTSEPATISTSVATAHGVLAVHVWA